MLGSPLWYWWETEPLFVDSMPVERFVCLPGSVWQVWGIEILLSRKTGYGGERNRLGVKSPVSPELQPLQVR